ncbi:hypothetical protein GXY_14767 [Novacetimonas hansenii ATCC 23769]|uniref:Uncharacterized protein n=1 Tax=Novacetimonas hansenii ATCC 23769 TaxID=714995 RepID=D5QIH2_NOVHA|nr:hypothetical protein GXY_14767 [Novacetimonas hansenii ATCC 23769]
MSRHQGRARNGAADHAPVVLFGSTIMGRNYGIVAK